MNFSDADLAGLLEATGDTVTLGATTVSAVIHAADARELEDAQIPGAALIRALSVTVKTGALAGLTAGATVVIRGSSYTVNTVLGFANGQLTRFLAVPA